MREPFNVITGKVLYLPTDNIDTDQIIPARFLKTVTKEGFGELLFHDHRYDAQGNPNREFAINQYPGNVAEILFAGDNFGCGSSREHAPWALTSYGIRAVIAPGFANIFKNNSGKNGLLLIELDQQPYQALKQIIKKNRDVDVTVDLPQQKIHTDGAAFSFEIDAFLKTCLIKGVDEFGYLLNLRGKIKMFESASGEK